MTSAHVVHRGTVGPRAGQRPGGRYASLVYFQKSRARQRDNLMLFLLESGECTAMRRGHHMPAHAARCTCQYPLQQSSAGKAKAEPRFSAPSRFNLIARHMSPVRHQAQHIGTEVTWSMALEIEPHGQRRPYRPQTARAKPRCPNSKPGQQHTLHLAWVQRCPRLGRAALACASINISMLTNFVGSTDGADSQGCRIVLPVRRASAW